MKRPFIRPIAIGALLFSIAISGGAPTAMAQAPQTTLVTDPAGTVEERLQALIDREEIGRIVIALGHSYDTRDWALHRSMFADEIQMDFSASIGSGLTTMQADEWVAAVTPFFESLDATQHIGMPLSIMIDGDRAEVVSMLHAQHFLKEARGEPVQRMIGSYDISLIRSDTGWKIVKIVQHIDWNEGNWYVFNKAAGISE